MAGKFPAFFEKTPNLRDNPTSISYLTAWLTIHRENVYSFSIENSEIIQYFMLGEQKYHRRADSVERDLVSKTGVLWGRSPRMCAGNGPPCVKAYVGPLPEGVSGYTFETSVQPTHQRRFFGLSGAIWEDGQTGVQEHPTDNGCVMIEVKIVDGC